MGTNHSARALVNWLILSGSTGKLNAYNIVNTNSKKNIFHNISMTYHVNLMKRGLPYICVNYNSSVSIQYIDGFVIQQAFLGVAN